MNLPQIIRTSVIALTILLGLWAAWKIFKLIRDRSRGGVKVTKRWRKVVGSVLMVIFVLIFGVFDVLLYTLDGIIGPFVTKSEGGSYVPLTNKTEQMELLMQIADEGMVLLKNEGNTLPIDISSSRRINLLGYRAYDPIYSGSGSGSVSAADAVSIAASLERAGFELNPALIEEGVYEQVQAEEASIGFNTASFGIHEAPMSAYKGSASFEKLKEYSGIAVIVFGRTGGEQTDLTLGKQADGKSYLQLSTEEDALLRTAVETFDRVIVVYNGANVMEMGYLDKYSVDACIFAGIPGPYGFESLGRIMNGTVNSSGRLVDTIAYDTDSSPANENFGKQKAENADSYYVDYVEGIYVGYKWYETAYEENAVITNTRTGETFDYSNYEKVVQYPFGYGLSYTTFTQEIVGGIRQNDVVGATDVLNVEVKVTNTGKCAGKDVVEVYVSAPYTAYDKEHGVEKAAVSLAGYAKTKELAPGESQTLTIEINMEALASYDATFANADGTKGAYRLDGGDYAFSIRHDSHNAIEQVSVHLQNDHVFSGTDKRQSDAVVAINRFDSAARGIYLSRVNGFENYAQAMGSVVPEVKDTTFDDDFTAYDAAYDENIPALTKGVDYAAKGNLKLSDMIGLAYDDPKWEQLISQLSVKDLVKIVAPGVYGTYAVDSVGKPQTSESDGPLGISSMFNPTVDSISYPSPALLASTYNDELAYAYGRCIADMAHTAGVSGWYAPAMNIHRSQFSGRNYEYYSEDAVLSGGIGAAETKGATDQGLIVYIKHFAFNDQESQRSGLHTYLNEQSAREIYLRPFEDSVKKGNANGVMTAMNYIGDEYVGYSKALMTEILRNEWGFKGMSISDMTSGDYMTASVDGCIRAGSDMWLNMFRVEPSSDNDSDIFYMQNVAKHVLYTYANATVLPAQMLPWRTFVAVIEFEVAALMVLTVVRWILGGKNSKKEQSS